MRLLTFLFCLFSICNAKAQTEVFYASTERPFGLNFTLNLPPLEGRPNQQLAFCTNHSAIDTVRYHYNQKGKLEYYSTLEGANFGLQFKEFRLGYDSLGRLISWEHLPDATNNGSFYSWSLDSIGNIISLETYETSTQGSILRDQAYCIESNAQYSVYQVKHLSNYSARINHIMEDFKDWDSLIFIDFHHADRVDSTWVFGPQNTNFNQPDYKYRYAYVERANKVICIQKLNRIETWYDGYWIVDPLYEGWVWMLPPYNYLPSTKGGFASFVVDSTWKEEIVLQSRYHFYSKGNHTWNLDSFGNLNQQALEVNHQWTYDANGSLVAAQIRHSPREWASYNFQHLLSPTDTGGVYAQFMNTRFREVQFWNCSAVLHQQQQSVEKGISVYPNPSRGALYLELSSFVAQDNAQILIYDNQSTLLFQQDVQGREVELNFEDWPRGIYQIWVRGANSCSHQTWIRY